MAKNVLGTELVCCCNDPVTGFYRNGKCDTSPEDQGQHTVCAEMSHKFLEFSRMQGNDLIAARPEWGFPGLKAGDFWCLCVARWAEAYQHGVAPRVKLEATHISVLEFVDLDTLKQFAVSTAE